MFKNFGLDLLKRAMGWVASHFAGICLFSAGIALGAWLF